MSVESGNTVFDSRDDCNAVIETATNTLIAGCKNSSFPSSVTAIGANAFIRRLGLSSVVIPNHVTSIGANAFSECSDLTSVSIGSGLTTIGTGVFGQCPALTSITVDAGNAKYDSRDNCNAIIETATNTLMAGCKHYFSQ